MGYMRRRSSAVCLAGTTATHTRHTERMEADNEKSLQFDWKAAATRWEHFSLIETPDQLYSGVLVCL
jgi:hypothetical protein